MNNVVVHTIGKVGTNTIYNTIRESCTNVTVHWTHCLVLEEYKRVLRHSKQRGEEYLESFNSQAAQAEHITALFQKNQVGMCITCFRHPYDHAISSLFHHAQYFFPELFDGKLDIQEKKRIVVERIETLFYDYVRKEIFPLSGPNRSIVANMTRCFRWWAREFETVHGINVMQLPPADDGFWQIKHNGLLYTFLRLENLRDHLPKIVEMITPGAQLQMLIGNISGKRSGDWGQIFRWFRTEYDPPRAMIDYYEQNPFTSLFYPEYTTVAEKRHQGL